MTGLVEIAAALVEATMGYHSAKGALQHAEDYIHGERETCWCEHCLCCFAGKLREKVEWCLRYWIGVPEERKARARAIVRVTKDWDWASAATLSMMYPTMESP